jgi:hypothetical protein
VTVTGGSSGGATVTALAGVGKTLGAPPGLKPAAQMATTATGVGGSSSGAAGTVSAETGNAPRAPLGLKLVAKRAAAVTGSGGSSPPCKRFCATWSCQGLRYDAFLELPFFKLTNSGSCFPGLRTRVPRLLLRGLEARAHLLLMAPKAQQ